MNENIIKELAAAYGWVEILPQKNATMVSFKRAEDAVNRVNVYFTRMTVQIQPFGGTYNSGRIFKEVSLPQLEDIFINYY